MIALTAFFLPLLCNTFIAEEPDADDVAVERRKVSNITPTKDTGRGRVMRNKILRREEEEEEEEWLDRRG